MLDSIYRFLCEKMAYIVFCGDLNSTVLLLFLSPKVFFRKKWKEEVDLVERSGMISHKQVGLWGKCHVDVNR